MTLGGAGVALYRAGREVRTHAAYAVEVVDTTGAGDAFNGALAWALADRKPLDAALPLAAAAGALACRAVGARASLATAAEVYALVTA